MIDPYVENLDPNAVIQPRNIFQIIDLGHILKKMTSPWLTYVFLLKYFGGKILRPRNIICFALK